MALDFTFSRAVCSGYGGRSLVQKSSTGIFLVFVLFFSLLVSEETICIHP